MVLSGAQVSDLNKSITDEELETVINTARECELSGDAGSAFEHYLKAAKMGDCESQFTLGVFYSEGSAAPKDDEESFLWWFKSANRGHYQAMYNVGVCYFNGVGTDKDRAEAVRWLEKAADGGHRIAKYLTAKEYYSGVNISRDFHKAAEYMSDSAMDGVVNAQLDYALICCTGQGLSKADPVLGFAWAICAGNNGDKRARKVIASIKTTYKLSARDLKKAQTIAKELI